MVTATVIALICSHTGCILIGGWLVWAYGTRFKHDVAVVEQEAEHVVTDAETKLRGSKPR